MWVINVSKSNGIIAIKMACSNNIIIEYQYISFLSPSKQYFMIQVILPASSHSLGGRMRFRISCVSFFLSSCRGGRTSLTEGVVPRGPPGGRAPLRPGALVLLTSGGETELLMLN